MSDTVITAIIGGVVAIILSINTAIADSNRRTSKRIRHQVENDHSTNMRVEQDERYEEQQKHNREVLNALSAIRKQLNRNTSRTNQLWNRYVNKH